MKRNAFILAMLLLSSGLYTAYADKTAFEPETREAPKLQQANISAPDFTFQDLDGKTHKLSDFRGKTVILNFWASWCTPCVIEFPQMLELASNNQKNTIFIFLSLDSNERDIVRFLKKYIKAPISGNVMVALDQDKLISQKLYQTYKIPETYLIDPNQQIKEKIIGAVDWSAPSIFKKIIEE